MPKLSFPTTELEMVQEAREYLLANGGTEDELAENQRLIDKYTAEGNRTPITHAAERELPRGDGRSKTTGDIQESLRQDAHTHEYDYNVIPGDGFCRGCGKKESTIQQEEAEGFGEAPQAAPVARKGTASPAAQEFAIKLCRQLAAMVPATREAFEDLADKVPDMSKAKVSQLIDATKAQIKRLEAQGVRAPQPDRLATDNQRTLIRRLLMEKISPVGELATRWEAVIGDAKLTFDEGGDLITELRAYPEREMVGEGMYRNPDNGEIYKVQIAHHGSGKLYAKLLEQRDEPTTKRGKTVTHEFRYIPGLLAEIQLSWKMTLQEAQEWGHLYGSCCRCGTILTDEKSIEMGIGPVCADKF